jgi:hypothetical protein
MDRTPTGKVDVGSLRAEVVEDRAPKDNAQKGSA